MGDTGVCGGGYSDVLGYVFGSHSIDGLGCGILVAAHCDLYPWEHLAGRHTAVCLCFRVRL